MSVTTNTEAREGIIGDIHIPEKIHGYSAYELAVKNGFKGSLDEWLYSFNAYSTAVKNGFKGSEEDWLLSLTAYGLAVRNGFEGTLEEWILSLKGEKGEPGTLHLHGDLDALGERIVNVADPVEDGDSVNKKYAHYTFVPFGYEDITTNFILTPEGGVTLPAINKISVLKKDREIRGFIEFDLTDYTHGIMCYINRDYLPEHTVVADAVVIDNESVPVGEYFPVMLKYFTPNQFTCWKPVPEGASKMLLNFSYICKENEVTE
ncbi:MAG: hypothetical protein U0K91_07255 [Acutalibacteraceae bacterium]|nr:hypothetical protein [Acutalibacteraceae bacterium]